MNAQREAGACLIEEIDQEKYVEMLEAVNCQAPEDAVFESEMCDAIHEALGLLEPTEATILKMLFGVGMLVDHSPEEIADFLGLSEQYVIEIGAGALRRLRLHSEAWRLEDCLDDCNATV